MSWVWDFIESLFRVHIKGNGRNTYEETVLVFCLKMYHGSNQVYKNSKGSDERVLSESSLYEGALRTQIASRGKTTLNIFNWRFVFMLRHSICHKIILYWFCSSEISTCIHQQFLISLSSYSKLLQLNDTLQIKYVSKVWFKRSLQTK